MDFMMSRLVPFFIAADPKRAADYYVRLATDPDLENVSGMYFVPGKEKPDASSALSRDPAVQQIILDTAEVWAAPFLPANLLSRQNANGSAPEPGAAGIAAAKSEAS
jgi:hypothetical protein